MARINTNRCNNCMGTYGIGRRPQGIFSELFLDTILYFDNVLKPAARAQVEIFGWGVDEVGTVLFTGLYKSIIPSLFVICTATTFQACHYCTLISRKPQSLYRFTSDKT